MNNQNQQENQQYQDMGNHQTEKQRKDLSVLCGFNSKDDVLENREALDQFEVLVYHSDAQVIGIVRVVDLYLLAVLFDHAFFSLVQAEQDGHEGRFTGTVFAKQGVYLALSQLQSDVVICYDAGKPFGDVHHFYGIRCIHNTVSSVFLPK